MTRIRHGVQVCGWLTLAALAVLTLSQGQGVMILQAGSWIVSLIALVLVAALISPRALARALPAAALAVLVGGVFFSLLPEQTGLKPVETMLQGTVGAAALAALASFAGRRDALALGDAILAGAFHAGLLQVMTLAPMVSPFALWPWLAPVLVCVWPVFAALVLGVSALFSPKPRPATPRRAP